MTSSQENKKSIDGLMADAQLIVEEKLLKVNGETAIRKYSKIRFLGKVIFPR